MAVAVLAAAAGAGATAVFTGSPAAPSAAGSSGRSPGYQAPGRSGNTAGPGTAPGYPVPGGSGGSAAPGQGGGPGAPPAGAVMRLFLTGRVTAVSATSITIAGAGPAVTAAVTPATRVTGQASGIGGIRVGYQVSAQITRQAGRTTLTALQYPAAPPPGGTVP